MTAFLPSTNRVATTSLAQSSSVTRLTRRTGARVSHRQASLVDHCCRVRGRAPVLHRTARGRIPRTSEHLFSCPRVWRAFAVLAITLVAVCQGMATASTVANNPSSRLPSWASPSIG